MILVWISTAQTSADLRLKLKFSPSKADTDPWMNDSRTNHEYIEVYEDSFIIFIIVRKQQQGDIKDVEKFGGYKYKEVG